MNPTDQRAPTHTAPEDPLAALEDAPLADRGSFDDDQLEALSDYGIETLGDLLGATRGLTDLEGLRTIRSDLAAGAVALRATLPDELLERFALDDPPMPATGWIPGEPGR